MFALPTILKFLTRMSKTKNGGLDQYDPRRFEMPAFYTTGLKMIEDRTEVLLAYC